MVVVVVVVVEPDMTSEACYDNNSDSDEGEPEEGSGVRIPYNLDDWLHFKVEPEVSC